MCTYSPNRLYYAKMALFIISTDRQTQVLDAVVMATTIIIDNNSWFPWSLSPAKCSNASACNNPSDSVTEMVILEQFDYYNQKQTKSYPLTWRIWTFCPQLFQPRFRARDLQAQLNSVPVSRRVTVAIFYFIRYVTWSQRTKLGLLLLRST